MIEKADEKKMPELLSAVKQFLKERLSGAIEDPVLQLTYGGTNPFFLKTPAGVIWVRVFEDALALPDIPALRHALERVSQMFRQKVRFVVFAPGYAADFSMSASHPQEMLFFEYFFLRSRFGQGVALRESKIKFSVKTLQNPSEQTTPLSPLFSPDRLRNVPLEREELSELINLSLELKGHGPSAPDF